MARNTDEWVKRMSPAQRRKWAFGFVALFALIAVLWGGYLYAWPSRRSGALQATGDAMQFRDADIIFQTSRSAQSQAIQLATGSRYSHCGLLFRKDGEGTRWYVLEAVQPVKWTPFTEWVNRGEEGKYVVKRVGPGQGLTVDDLGRIRHEAERFLGMDYDLGFAWDDERIYCSELIWKAYNRGAGLELGELAELRSFNLSWPVVMAQMKERYGDRIPEHEPVISPAAIFQSPLLETVADF